MPLREEKSNLRILFLLLLSVTITYATAQENSPYSRYGLGNTLPTTNVVNRGMGGISAAYADALSVNFSNPASYSRFQANPEERSKRLSSGRVLFDVGINIESKTLQEPNNPLKFSSTGGSFSHLQLGIPLRKGWGLSFGLRQLNRIAYKVGERGAIYSGGNGSFIDSGYTEYAGNGGTFLPNIGTGIALKNLSLGVTAGYLFGRREFSTTRTLFDSVELKPAFYDTDASYGGLFFTGGAQYRLKLSEKTALALGVSGNLQHNLKGSRDVIRVAIGNTGSDTIYRQSGVNGNITYPASYTAGFVVERVLGKNGSFMVGTDFIQNKWARFRYFGAVDSVQDNWQLRIGTQLRPNAEAGSGYFSNVTYRAGFFFGPDYIRVVRNLPVYGLSFGMGLPIANYNRLSPGQFTVLNVAFEYEQRGNNENVLKENVFRISVGLNFSDLWFSKRKYD
jgi:hypothetical protein